MYAWSFQEWRFCEDQLFVELGSEQSHLGDNQGFLLTIWMLTSNFLVSWRYRCLFTCAKYRLLRTRGHQAKSKISVLVAQWRARNRFLVFNWNMNKNQVEVEVGFCVEHAESSGSTFVTRSGSENVFIDQSDFMDWNTTCCGKRKWAIGYTT
jgi:hypothetical protein